MNLEDLFQQAFHHRNEHDCSAYPYEEYEKLFVLVNQYQPKRILEIGTGMGFTSVVMALANPEAHTDTIEKDQEHVKAAREFIASYNLTDRITVHHVVAEEFLATLPGSYDLIFFDGYQIHYEFLPHYERLLTATGILILGNNQLNSKTSDQFFSQLADKSKWKILGKFADTTIAERV